MSKKRFRNKINIYFLFVALIFTVSAYLLLLNSWGGYTSRIYILITPKNTKTAVYLSELKEGVVAIAHKRKILDTKTSLISNPENNLIEIKSQGETREQSIESLNNSVKNFLNLFSQFYDIKNDLNLEIVSKETIRENNDKFFILFLSVIIGAILSLFVQFVISLVENTLVFFLKKRDIDRKESAQAEKYLGDFLKINREKIQKLSSSSPLIGKTEIGAKKNDFSLNHYGARFDKIKVEDQIKKDVPEEQPFVYFKKAASPSNLPIAEDDLNKIVQIERDEEIKNEQEILNELGIYSENSLAGISTFKEDKKDELIQEKENNDEMSNKDELEEPTEEEFKKRLNQLLGNK